MLGRNVDSSGPHNDPSQIFDPRLMQSNDGLGIESSAELLYNQNNEPASYRHSSNIVIMNDNRANPSMDPIRNVNTTSNLKPLPNL